MISQKVRGQFVRFALVGAVNTGIDLAIFTLLISIGAPLALAHTVSYVVATANSYWMNRFWTFKGDAEQKETVLIVKFLAVNLTSYALSLGFLTLMVEVFHIHPIVSKILAIGVSVVVNFGGNKLFVFKKR